MSEEERKKAEEKLQRLLNLKISWPAEALVGITVDDAAMGRSIMEERIRSEKLQKFYGGKNNMEKNVERSYKAGIELIEQHFERKMMLNADQYAEYKRKFKEKAQEYQLTVEFVNKLNEVAGKSIDADEVFCQTWYSEQTAAERKRILDEERENEERIYQDKLKCVLEYNLCETYEQRIACLEKWRIL